MINKIVSSVFIIITVLAMCAWILTSIYGINSTQNFSRTILSFDKIEDTAKLEFLLNDSLCVSRSSLNGDENITLLNHSLPHNSIPVAFEKTLWQLKQTDFVKPSEIVVNHIIPRPVPYEDIKMHNNFRYGINRSNQENNLQNSLKQQPTPLLFNIKLVNSSNLTPPSSLSSPSSPGATATGFRPTSPELTVSPYFERVEMQESFMRSKNEKLLLLHRNKRYLLFPEGSSFQLVFDLIIPIVDYTNFAIMGITCAVAWELPSKPPSEIIENFRTKLNDGTFGLSRRNDSVLKPLVYIKSQHAEQQPAVGKKRWREGVVGIGNDNLPQLSPATATTSGREHFLTYAPKPPFLHPSSSFNYNNYIPRKQNQAPLPFSYGQQTQQPHSHDYETFNTNHRQTLNVNTNGKIPIYRNDFYPNANKRVYYKDFSPLASKWNGQQKINRQRQKTNIFYSDKEDYLHNHQDNWWIRNKNRMQHQPNWSKYQQNPQAKFQKLASTRRTARKRKILLAPPKHRIYPIFGKRRRRRSAGGYQTYFGNDNLAKKLYAIHTREHLQTRLKLYGKIEKLYKTRGHNGTACVLRALCETERMHLNSYNEKPQSFVMELLRSIFALPKDTLTHLKESLLQVDDRYMNAVFQAHDGTQTCSQQYNACGYSIASNT